MPFSVESLYQATWDAYLLAKMQPSQRGLRHAIDLAGWYLDITGKDHKIEEFLEELEMAANIAEAEEEEGAALAVN